MHGPKYDSEIYRNAAYYIVFNMIMIQKKKHLIRLLSLQWKNSATVPSYTSTDTANPNSSQVKSHAIYWTIKHLPDCRPYLMVPGGIMTLLQPLCHTLYQLQVCCNHLSFIHPEKDFIKHQHN